MELRAFAESIVQGDRLIDKLVDPGELTDSAPGARVTVSQPARPPELQFVEARIKDELPARIESTRERGRLLHRFANHELLALEIMAATLLRFPDAPAAFRIGLGRTMVEEQRHLRLYLDRMATLGVGLGEIPVNSFFWRSTQDLASPYDYVLRMPLLFEQANLDFLKMWRGRFAAVGDDETVAVLDTVYADEIGHVRGGLQLFRAWKDPAVGEWEAFEAGLTMPLSPARARGPQVDHAGRLDAGFTPDWIERLELYARSRGRTPRVYLFNPSCEDEVARGRPGHSPNAQVAALTADLAPLMVFLAAREDAVILPTLPSAAWLKQIAAAGFPLPEVVQSPAALADRKLAALVPWGRSPQVETAYAPLTGALWQDAMRPAFSKVEALRWRADVLAALGEDWLAPAEGDVVTTRAEGEAAAARGWILKAPWSTAGRDRRRGPLDAAGVAWLDRILATQGAVRAEPWRERVLDLSFHYELGDTMRSVGTCRFLTTPNGQFCGTMPGRWMGELPHDQARLFNGDGQDPRRLRRVADTIGRVLGPALAALGIRGAVGVDAFVYRDGDRLRLDPLVEVNPRYTMGRVSLALEDRLHPHARATWRFLNVKGLGGDPLAWFARESEREPLVHQDGLLRSGVLATNDPATAKQSLSVLWLT